MAMPIPPHLPNCFDFAGLLSLHSRSLACTRDERSHADQNRRSASQFIIVPRGLAKQTWIRTGCSFASPQCRDYCLQICISPPRSLHHTLSTAFSRSRSLPTALSPPRRHPNSWMFPRQGSAFGHNRPPQTAAFHQLLSTISDHDAHGCLQAWECGL
ncbi:hypothetical protein BC831DRAFT_496049, partial [Entophlyctis helioformis]